MTVAYISHPDCYAHDMGPIHPEAPARLAAINDRLIASGLEMAIRHYDAPEATDSQLRLAHDPDYLDSLTAANPEEGLVWLDDDTALSSTTLEAARRSAGAVVKAVDLVLSDEVTRAFCAVRPPGHHACRNRAMGFCFYNNIAIGALHALEHGGLERVAIVDFDVHHGNGTEHIVAGDDRILFCSSFQHPCYPHACPEGSAANVLNLPLSAGTTGEAFRDALRNDCLPRLAAFAPQLLLVSAGFDAHQADDMGELGLVDRDYGWIAQELCAIADSSAQGRLIATLEGGYELTALASSVEAVIRAFVA